MLNRCDQIHLDPEFGQLRSVGVSKFQPIVLVSLFYNPASILPRDRIVTSETGFLRRFLVTKRKTHRNPVSRPPQIVSEVSETGFLCRFLVTKRKTHRNPVSRPSYMPPETGFLPKFLATKRKTHRNPVSRPRK